MTVRVEAPRLNANEDQVEIVQILAREGDKVEKDDLLFVAETTKASSDILAPASGVVRSVAATVGAMVDVGAILCVIETVPTAALAGTGPLAASPVVTAASPKITLKARRRAEELGVSLADVPPANGRVGVEQVEAFAISRRAVADPALGARHSVSGFGNRAVVVGAGGHAASVIDLLLTLGYDIAGCIDQRGEVGRVVLDRVEVIGDERALPRLREDGVRIAFVGVGGATDNTARRTAFERLATLDFVLPPLVAPTATLGRSALIGSGSVIFPGAVVGPRVVIGANCIINAGVVVCHDSTVGDHCHLTPGALIAGDCRIGMGTTIGMAATLLNQSEVGVGCLIHNTATIWGRIPDATEVTAKGLRRQRRLG